MTSMPLRSYKPTQIFSEQVPFYYMQGDNVIGRRPSDNSGTINVWYYKLNPILVDDEDSLPVPMRGYTNGFVNYALAQAYYKDNKKEMGDGKLGEANNTMKKFVNESTPRDKSGPSYIELVESIDPNLEPFI